MKDPKTNTTNIFDADSQNQLSQVPKGLAALVPPSLFSSGVLLRSDLQRSRRDRPTGELQISASGVTANASGETLTAIDLAGISGISNPFAGESLFRTSNRNLDAIAASSGALANPAAAVESVNAQDAAQFLALGFGARDSSKLEISGSLESQAAVIAQAENDDAIASANATGLTAGNFVTASGTIGDGLHGSGGTGTGDFDFYAVTAEAGQIITVNTETDNPRGGLDTILGLYDSAGNRLTLDNDSSSFIGLLNSTLNFTAPTAGTYFVAVGGTPTPDPFAPPPNPLPPPALPSDPLTPGTGPGVGTEGAYDINIGLFTAATPISATEGNDAIPFATVTGLTLGNRVTTTAFIGDGDHGSEGTGTGDFDFYAIDAGAGESITINAENVDPVDPSNVDPFAALNLSVSLYDSAGNALTLQPNFDGFGNSLSFTTTKADTYFAVVNDVSSGLPSDPFTPGTGEGATPNAGAYNLTLGLDSAPDLDFYSFELNPGDVLGASVSGRATELTLFAPNGDRLLATQLGSFDPDASPLPSSDGSTDLAYVIDTAGTYTLAAAKGTGDYDLDLEVFRPPLEQAATGSKQTLFLDFDGATFNPNEVYGQGIEGNGIDAEVTTSPLSAFLPNWGLTAADENAVIDAIVAGVTEDLETDIRQLGSNSNFDIEILNSRDHADPFGNPNVSRVVIGGTGDEIGIPTIGIASTIDPGNLSTTDEAITLLDALSAPADSEFGPISLNSTPLAPGTSIIDLIGEAVGNITAHEAGHFFGNFHTSPVNLTPNTQDSGGTIFGAAGVGADGIFGTDDDIDIDFGRDSFSPFEFRFGTEDTLNNIAFGLSTPLNLAETAETSVQLGGGSLVINDIKADSTDNLTLSERRGIVFISDSDNLIRAGQGIFQATPNLVEAIADEVSRVTINANGGNDNVDAAALVNPVVLNGGDGDDRLRTGEQQDNLFGGSGNDTLQGGADRDLLNGDQGTNQLDGGADDDRLFGGSGTNAFVLRTGDGNDSIFGYRDGTDTFALDGLVFEDLSIQQGAGQTTLELDATDEVLATLPGVQATSIDATDFSTLA